MRKTYLIGLTLLIIGSFYCCNDYNSTDCVTCEERKTGTSDTYCGSRSDVESFKTILENTSDSVKIRKFIEAVDTGNIDIVMNIDTTNGYNWREVPEDLDTVPDTTLIDNSDTTFWFLIDILNIDTTYDYYLTVVDTIYDVDTSNIVSDSTIRFIEIDAIAVDSNIIGTEYYRWFNQIWDCYIEENE